MQRVGQLKDICLPSRLYQVSSINP